MTTLGPQPVAPAGAQPAGPPRSAPTPRGSPSRRGLTAPTSRSWSRGRTPLSVDLDCPGSHRTRPAADRRSVLTSGELGDPPDGSPMASDASSSGTATTAGQARPRSQPPRDVDAARRDRRAATRLYAGRRSAGGLRRPTSAERRCRSIVAVLVGAVPWLADPRGARVVPGRAPTTFVRGADGVGADVGRGPHLPRTRPRTAALLFALRVTATDRRTAVEHQPFGYAFVGARRFGRVGGRATVAGARVRCGRRARTTCVHRPIQAARRPRRRRPARTTGPERGAPGLRCRARSGADEALREVAVTLSSATRSCVMSSRWRMVTAWSSSVSKSTVMQNGVPISSWRR